MNTNFSMDESMVTAMANTLSLGTFGFTDYSILIIVIIISLVLILIKVSKRYIQIKTSSTSYYESAEDKFLMHVSIFLVIKTICVYLALVQKEQKVENLKIQYADNKKVVINPGAFYGAVGIFLWKRLEFQILNQKIIRILNALLFIYILVLIFTSPRAEPDKDFLLKEFKRIFKSLDEVNGLFCIYTPNRRAIEYVKYRCRVTQKENSIARDSMFYDKFMPKAIYFLQKMKENYSKTLNEINEYLAKTKDPNNLVPTTKKFKLLSYQEFYLKLLNSLNKARLSKDLNKLSCKTLIYEYTDILYCLPEKEIAELFYANHTKWNMENTGPELFAICKFSLIQLIQIQIYLFNGIMVYAMVDFEYVKNNTGKQFYRCVSNLHEIPRHENDKEGHGRDVFFADKIEYERCQRPRKKRKYSPIPKKIKPIYFTMPKERTTGNYYILNVIYITLFIHEEFITQRDDPKIALWFDVYIHKLKILLNYFRIDKKQINIMFYKNLHDDWKERYKRFIRTYLKEYDNTI